MDNALKNKIFHLGLAAITVMLLSSSLSLPLVFANSSNTGILEPMYAPPYQNGAFYWQPANLTKATYTHVPYFFIANPNNGPGSINCIIDYQNAIKSLTKTGIVVLGYTYTQNSTRPIIGPENAIDRWYNCYGAGNATMGNLGIKGIFFDEMSNRNLVSNFTYYQTLTNYTHNKGLKYAFGNPGTETIPNYTKTIDHMTIYEVNGILPSNATLQGTTADGGPPLWHTNYDKSNFSFMVYNRTGLPTLPSWFSSHSLFVRFMFITNDGGNTDAADLFNPWDQIPSQTWLSTIASKLNFTSVALTIQSLNKSNSAQLAGLPIQISQASGTSSTLLRQGNTTLVYNATQTWPYQITAKNLCPYTFDHWDDGTTAPTRTVTAPSSNTTYTAYYAKTC